MKVLFSFNFIFFLLHRKIINNIFFFKTELISQLEIEIKENLFKIIKKTKQVLQFWNTFCIKNGKIETLSSHELLNLVVFFL